MYSTCELFKFLEEGKVIGKDFSEFDDTLPKDQSNKFTLYFWQLSYLRSRKKFFDKCGYTNIPISVEKIFEDIIYFPEQWKIYFNSYEEFNKEIER